MNGVGSVSCESLDVEVDSTIGLVPKRTRRAVSFRADDTDNWGVHAMDDTDNYQLLFTDTKQADSLAARLNTLRKNRELCDVVLFVAEHEIAAHKAVLAAVSPALFDMFKSNGEGITAADTAAATAAAADATPRAAASTNGAMVAAVPAQSYFEFPHGDLDCFNALVNFAYTSCLEIRSKKVAELYKTACALRIQTCAKACATYLAQNLSVTNCIGIRKCANFTNDVLLANKVDCFLAENVADVVQKSVEFTQIPCIKVRIILRTDQLTKEGEMLLAEKTLTWFQTQQPFDRIDQRLEQLVEKMHLLYLDEDQSLQDCVDMDDRSSVGSCDLVQDYKRSGSSRRSMSTSGSAVGAQPQQHHVMGATSVRINASRVGNRYSSCESLNSLSSTSSDNVDEVEWKMIAVTQTADEYWVALTILHRRLVALSIQLSENDDLKPLTTNGDKVVDRPTILMPAHVNGSAERCPLPTMNQARCSVGAVCLLDKIVVCGGYDRGECLRTVEQYDTNKAVWSFLPPMCSERGRFDAVVANGKLYAVAGSNGANDLVSVECYDPQTSKWTQKAPLKLPRSHNSCASVNDVVYSIGGCNEQNVLRQCDRYLPERDQWQPIASLNTGRYQAGCTTWRDMVLACGGCDRWSCTDSVELYDPRANSWRPLNSLKSARRGCSVAVVNDQLFVIGGSDGVQSLTSVEVLDLTTGNWRTGPELSTPRANVHAVVTADMDVYVIGGFDGKQFLSTMEILEAGSGEWRNWQPKTTSWAISEDPVAETAADEGLDNLSIENGSN